MSKVEQYITSIPDFPKEGIIFRDITTVLGDADGFPSGGGRDDCAGWTA